MQRKRVFFILTNKSSNRAVQLTIILTAITLLSVKSTFLIFSFFIYNEFVLLLRRICNGNNLWKERICILRHTAAR